MGFDLSFWTFQTALDDKQISNCSCKHSKTLVRESGHQERFAHWSSTLLHIFVLEFREKIKPIDESLYIDDNSYCSFYHFNTCHSSLGLPAVASAQRSHVSKF